MKKFDVEITETLQRKVSVEAASQEDAERMVTQAWNNQDYVLDSGDFTGVDFKTVGEHELAETRTMDVLLVQPNAYPKKISVGTELEDLQAMVGGDIEVTYPFEDEVAIILNESGKINGLPLNRAIYTEDGDMQIKIIRAKDAIASQKPRTVRCPYCRHNSIIVFEDTRGHVQTKCKACGRETVFNVLEMRRLRRLQLYYSSLNG